MDAIHTEDYNGLTIRIEQDEDSQNPRTKYDNFGHMICFHSRYDLGDKHEMSKEDLLAMIKRKDVIALPLYLYDHSGITMSTTPFNDRWDSSHVGYVYTTFKDIRENYMVKRVTKAIKEKAIELMKAEVANYDDYLTNNVYGYVIEDQDGETLDSCWGFYGDYDKYCLVEAKSSAQDLIEARMSTPA